MENQTMLRTGLVGCGWHGSALAQAIVRSPSLQLVACADPDAAAASRAAAFAQEVSTHTSVEALLAEAAVDTVVVATPHHLLAPVALAALRAGKHVMAEKPIGLNEHEAIEIERVVAESGLCYMAGYSMRFSMGRYVRELLDAGVTGDIHAITGSFCVGQLDSDWIAYPETGGGPLLFVGSHLIDWILWCLGDEPVEVFANVQNRADTGADEVTAFQIRFAKGAIAQGLTTQAESALFFEVDIRGRSGKITLRGRNFLQFEIEVSSSAVAAYREPTIIRPGVRGDNINMMLVPELEEFASAIRERRSPSVTVADGRRVLRVIDGIFKSGQCNQPVKLLH